MPTFLHVPPIGIGHRYFNDGFTYDGSRPARHCKLCGDSYQPELARSPDFNTSLAIQHEVQYLLKEWAVKHNNTHSTAQHEAHIKSGRLLTPEAALKLIPLGIYPLDDLTFDDEIIQAGLEAPRAPKNDIKHF